MLYYKKHIYRIYKFFFLEKLIQQLTNNINFNINSIIITFYLKNISGMRDIFYCNKILLERLLLFKGNLLFSNKNIPFFNIKKNTPIGYKFKLYGERLFIFLYNFLIYSIGKLYNFFLMGIKKKKYKKKIFNSYLYFYKSIGFGLKKILFFNLFNNIQDWNIFTYFYEGMIYGLDIYIYTNYSNYYYNRIILSAYGFNFI